MALITCNYTFEGNLYEITDTEEEHRNLQNDDNYFALYLRKQNQKQQEFSWTRENVLLLIENYTMLKDRFRDPHIKKKELWSEIKMSFAVRGYIVTEDVLDRKWRNLKKTYTTIKDNAKRTGRGRIAWEYYKDFEDIYAEDHNINPPLVISSWKNVTEGASSLPHEELPPLLPTPAADPTPSTSTAPPVLENEPSTSASFNTPCPSSNSKKTKTERNKGLYHMRKKFVDIEEKRIEEIRLLRQALEESNSLQRERNNILRELLQ